MTSGDAENGGESPRIHPSYIPVLDVWRGLAIVLLLVGHFRPLPRINCGRLGVEFFFVLSGFLMGRLLFVKRTPIDVFYKRRISRIFPAAYTFLLICLFFNLGTDAEPSNAGVGILSCFLFFVNYYVALHPGGTIGLPAGHFWSLCVEEHSYILLSLLAVAERRCRAPGLLLLGGVAATCLGIAIVLGTRYGWDYYRVYWRSDTHAASIVAGAIAACLAARGVGARRAYLRVASARLGLVLLAVGCLCNYYRVPDVLKYSIGTAFLAASLLLISRHVDGRPWPFRPFIWLGTVSYSLYLWQQPFYHAMQAGRLGAGAALGAAVLAGLASFHLVERPMRQRLNRIWADGPASRGAPASQLGGPRGHVERPA